MRNEHGKSGRKSEGQNMETNGDWLDGLEEKELLLILSGLLYSYDNRLSIFDENGDLEEEKWKKAFTPMMEYAESRLGRIMSGEVYREWEELPHK